MDKRLSIEISESIDDALIGATFAGVIRGYDLTGRGVLTRLLVELDFRSRPLGPRGQQYTGSLPSHVPVCAERAVSCSRGRLHELWRRRRLPTVWMPPPLALRVCGFARRTPCTFSSSTTTLERMPRIPSCVQCRVLASFTPFRTSAIVTTREDVLSSSPRATPRSSRTIRSRKLA